MPDLGKSQNHNTGYPEDQVHGANMGPIWGRQDPGGPPVGSMNFAILVKMVDSLCNLTAPDNNALEVLAKIAARSKNSEPIILLRDLAQNYDTVFPWLNMERFRH